MTRTRTSLDGTWEFQIDPAAAAAPDHLATWRTATVPSPWQAEAEDLRDVSGVGWYRRRLQVPAGEGAAILHFGAVDYHARVWVNGVLVGEHEGGYLPFEFDVAALLTGDDELLVRVEDPTDDRDRYPEAVFSEVPHGKQSWYGPLSGIWQSVWIERRSALHLESVRLDAELASGDLHVRAMLSQPAVAGTRLRVSVPGSDAAPMAVDVPGGVRTAEASVRLDAVRPWSPDAPHLYDVAVEVLQAGEVVDRVVEQTGFRTIASADGRLLLNGEPLLLRAALDQDYYAETIATVPSLDVLEEQARRAKELGLNCLRCHIKIPDPRYLEVADRFGLLVWAELPNWRHFTPAAAERARETFAGMLERDANHPSIVAWTIVNEDWGTDLVHEADHRRWVQETYRWAKELDPTRLVIDNSACPPNFHVETDIEDYHFYRAIPDRRDEWDAFVDEFADRAAPTYSPNGDAVRTGSEPLVVSEFGNWGLPRVDLLRDAAGREPWWFDTGDEWEGGVVRPHGIEERFRCWHLDKVFGDLPAFAEATQWQQYRALKYQIESIRRRPEIAGYVITELTDTHWEPNGLLDADRRPKIFHQQMASICADTVVIPRSERVAYTGGEIARVSVVVATGGRPRLDAAVLRWRLGAMSGEVTVRAMAAMEAVEVTELKVELPAVTAASVARLHVDVYAETELVASNHLDVTVHPPSRSEVPMPSVWCPDGELAGFLTALGCELADHRGTAELFVSTSADDELVEHVRAGGRGLLLLERPGPLHTALPGLTAVERRGGVWDGDWASTFAWLRRDGHATALPGGPLLDEAFVRVVPELVIDGVQPWEFEADVLAGVVVGWIHRPAGLAVRRRYGRGELVATTFRLLRDAPGADPTAAKLLEALLRTSADVGRHAAR